MGFLRGGKGHSSLAGESPNHAVRDTITWTVMSPRGFHEGHQARAITVPERNPDTSATGAGGDSLARPSGTLASTRGGHVRVR
jgi:hypothetical protein